MTLKAISGSGGGGGPTTNPVSFAQGGTAVNTIDGRIITAAGAVTMNNNDRIVNIAKTVGASTAVTSPPSPSAWQIFTVKDAKGDAFTNPITITPSSGTIDGAATYVIGQNYDSIDFYSDGTNLFTK